MHEGTLETSYLVRPTVLVVDDEEQNRAIAIGGLRASYDVLEAESGPEALEILSSSRVDLVLLDVMMPAMSGFDVCRAIKARQGGAFLPVVLVTALNSQEDRNQGLAVGADEFLSKPIDLRELGLRVRSLVKLRAQEQRIRQDMAELKAKEVLIRKQLEELRHLQALKDDLFSLIVHDLRNPLSGVVGFLELLQVQLVGPSLAKARTNADLAADAAKKLRDLLDETLEVQRLEHDGFPVDKQPTALGAIARDAIRTLEGAARGRTIAFQLEVEGDPSAAVDRVLVRRAFENLLANALKFSPSNSAITVDVRRVDGRVVIAIADRGPGVGEAKGKLFKKFAAVEAKRTGDRRRGFGLGLHLVKLVADAHGGEAFVRDREGGGSVFGIAFPEGAP